MAQEQASLPFYDFMYGKYLLKDLFDIKIHEDDYVERAYNIWRDIGNIATSIHAFEVTIDDSCIVVLPCNVEFVESVSDGRADDCGGSVMLYHADWSTNPNVHLADAVTRNPNAKRVDISDQGSRLHPTGEFVPYELHGKPGSFSLQFDSEFIGTNCVCIYRGICVDPEGNPLLTRKEAEAIAYKMAFIDTQKRFFMNDPNAGAKLEYIKTEMGRKMAAAKIPEYLSQNHINRLLSSLTRHDRKVFWSSYKTLQ